MSQRWLPASRAPAKSWWHAPSIDSASAKANRYCHQLRGIPSELLESELFGYEQGAFTSAVAPKPGKFELANGGTIFLDEIGNMPLNMQAKILRVLQEQEIERLGSQKSMKIDVRVVSATNANLKKDIKDGKFREDLFHRLNVVPIPMPPLRDRKEDLGVYVAHFLEKLKKKYTHQFKGITSEALKRSKITHGREILEN